MWSMKAIILLLFCYARPLSGKVYFVSENFNNTLHWDPLEPAPPEEKVLYSVQYKSDAMDQFCIKKECQNITALSCDLTTETVSVYDVQYEARVFVNGSSYGKTMRFKPLAETVLGPPKLSINTTVSSLHMNVTLPLGPNGISIADIINRSTTGQSKGVVIYTLNITEPMWAALVNKTTSGRFVINLNNNHYCGHVVYKPLSDWGRSESQKAFFCARLQGDHRKLLPWLLTGATLPAVVIMMLVLYMWKYAKGGKQKRMPQSLVSTLPTQRNVLQYPDEKFSIYKATVCTTKTVYATITPKPEVPSTGNEGYSPQDVIFQACTSSSVGTDGQSPTPNPQDTSSHSSEIYSVVAVHVSAEQIKDIRQPITDDQTNTNVDVGVRGEMWREGGAMPTLAMPQNMDVMESNSAKPLMLDTVRNQQGQLVLSSLFSLLQSSTGDDVSPLSSERKPLLSDLIDTKMEGPALASLQSFDSSEWSDSGCDDSNINTPTIYSPSQPNFHQACTIAPRCEAIFESGYKQNWIPEILLGADGKDN